MKYLGILFFLLLSKSIFAEIPNIENRDKEKIKKGIANTFIRSMNKWDIPFNDLLENRSGSACINWQELNESFLENGIFDALGYSQNIPNKKASQIASISGCKKMKEYYKLKNTCSCQVILTNSDLEINLPIKKFNAEDEFKDAVNLYKKKEYKESYKKFLKLSELGDGKSQYNLAVIIYKGEGFTQNFKKSYYWALISKLNGQKKSEKLINKSKKKLNKDEINEINDQVKEDLEKLVEEGKAYALIPLAKWHLTVPKNPDYNNSYKWLSVASALDIPNTTRARNRIFNKVNKKALTELQEESNSIYNNIIESQQSNKTEE